MSYCKISFSFMEYKAAAIMKEQ